MRWNKVVNLLIIFRNREISQDRMTNKEKAREIERKRYIKKMRWREIEIKERESQRDNMMGKEKKKMGNKTVCEPFGHMFLFSSFR